MLCHRKGWKYIGVWERGKESSRLHFHGIFIIPEGTMPGELKEIKDYQTTKHKMQKSYQNTYFNNRFGRSDFKEIDCRTDINQAIMYIIKYIEKSGERIVYSKGLPQYFLSDILDEDVICPIGIEDKKILLFDDFYCIDDGEIIGNVSPEVIKLMPKSNE